MQVRNPLSYSAAQRMPSRHTAIMGEAALQLPSFMALLVFAGSYLLGTCYTRRDSLGRMIVDKNLPATITTDITKELAEKIALPFGRKFSAWIEKLQKNPNDPRITKPVNLESPTIDDLAIEDVLFDMLGEANTKGEPFDGEMFGAEYEDRLSQAMKNTYFKDQPITEEGIKQLIQALKMGLLRN